MLSPAAKASPSAATAAKSPSSSSSSFVSSQAATTSTTTKAKATATTAPAVAAVAASHLTAEQWRDLGDVLRRHHPLMGQSVFVPIGSKAFAVGHLTPTTITTTTTTSSCGSDDGGSHVFQNQHNTTTARHDDEQEQVWVRNQHSNDYEIMTRQQALQWCVDQQQEQYAKEKRPTGAPKTTNSSFSDSLSESEAKQQTHSTAIRSVAGNENGAVVINDHDDVDSAEEDASDRLFPFVEIREEYDATGRQTIGQAVNVTKHLEYWQQMEQQQQQQAGDPSAESVSSDSTHPHHYRSTTVSYNNSKAMTKSSKGLDPAITHNDDDKKQANNDDSGIFQSRDDLVQSPCTVSDDAYKALSARLDELARLEELSETAAHNSHISSHRLQGKGWSKGFLNNKDSKQIKKTNPLPSKSSMMSSSRTKARTPLSDTTAIAATVTPTAAAKMLPTNVSASSLSSPPPTKAVAFASSDNHQVHEIPRIGHRSIRELTQRGNTMKSTTTTTDPLFAGSIREKRLSSPSLSSKHRPKATTMTKTTMMTTAIPRANTAPSMLSSSSSSYQQPPQQQQQQKLSRFAQERQQMRQQQEQQQHLS